MEFTTILLTALGSSSVTAVISYLMNRGKNQAEEDKINSDRILSQINLLVEKSKQWYEEQIEEWKQKYKDCEESKKDKP